MGVIFFHFWKRRNRLQLLPVTLQFRRRQIRCGHDHDRRDHLVDQHLRLPIVRIARTEYLRACRGGLADSSNPFLGSRHRGPNYGLQLGSFSFQEARTFVITSKIENYLSEF
jgi:hypothetical protein